MKDYYGILGVPFDATWANGRPELIDDFGHRSLHLTTVAGKKLTEMINAMGLSREQVYITNILKVRPPENRTPLKHEVEATWPFLAEQIRIIDPKVIITLGGPSTKLILGTETGITRLRGIWAEYRDLETGHSVPVMPTFHPAYLLRQYTVENRQKVWSDMLAALDRLGLPRPGSAE